MYTIYLIYIIYILNLYYYFIYIIQYIYIHTVYTYIYMHTVYTLLIETPSPQSSKTSKYLFFEWKPNVQLNGGIPHSRDPCSS